MKTQLRNSLLSAVMLILTCSFVEAPDFYARSLTEDNVAGSPPGGAYLIFAGKHGGEISPRELEGHRELKVDGCAAGARVLQFNLEITKGGKTSYVQAESNILSTELLTRLKSLSAGDSFEFKQVKARLLDTRDVVDVSSKRFFVVDKGV